MIILEGVPKHPTDPSTGPTNRDAEPDIEAPAPSSRPPSPNPSLPAYESLEAQQSSHLKQSGSPKFWYTRVGKLIAYALVVYSVLVVVVGVPMFVMVGFLVLTIALPTTSPCAPELKIEIEIEITQVQMGR